MKQRMSTPAMNKIKNNVERAVLEHTHSSRTGYISLKDNLLKHGLSRHMEKECNTEVDNDRSSSAVELMKQFKEFLTTDSTATILQSKVNRKATQK